MKDAETYWPGVQKSAVGWQTDKLAVSILIAYFKYRPQPGDSSNMSNSEVV